MSHQPNKVNSDLFWRILIFTCFLYGSRISEHCDYPSISSVPVSPRIIANPLYFTATIVKLSEDLPSEESSTVKNDLRQVLLASSRSTFNLAVNSSATAAEMLRLRRCAHLSHSKHSLLEAASNKVITAPLTSSELFGDRLTDALDSNREDLFQASVLNKSGSGHHKSTGSSKKRPGSNQQQADSKKRKPEPKSGSLTESRSPLQRLDQAAKSSSGQGFRKRNKTPNSSSKKGKSFPPGSQPRPQP